ncbi:molybdopterin-containing oxidoreductase I, DMSO/TMAO/BSO reductase family, catalytic subunit [Campylobacter blaseri]|uniref:Biotin sulfoxide reductase n=1 Tax=Campylobacter blaseri TaxID=2042961 RepID=A0A2P8QYD9_9BACT|nr:molybdopterin-dependent oxidoreductase [Campylobacter blaseri]PSM51276.1 biotin sulfoxide reductase [Campylobacter blaseri]PSM52420.1 biotin sulfoxide reductase [Campylobacter blaseri]QKF86251.1 molybdopterin-containing oxidoreductase I, DMSO/TMAO/BSO reductase family, catalytic subunit [Campylobacter blaseri]
MAITRRKFLQSSVATTALAVSANPLLANEKGLKSIPHASNIGAFYADVNKDGEIVKIRPQESDKDPKVPWSEAWKDRVYSDTRIKYPCVRKSYLEGKKSPELRGKEEFVRVSWDKAMELILDKLKSVKIDEIYNASYGSWGHPGMLHSCSAVAGRFFNTVFGGAVGTDGEYSNGAAGKVNTTVMGDLEVYSLQTAHEVILENTQVYVMWGADILKCNQVDYKVPSRANNDYYKKYAKSNIKFITIDPQYTEIAKDLNAQWIKIRPNTDVALMLGMMHYLYTTKQYDKNFIEKYTDGFDKFLPYLLGKTEDKVEKTASWASKITGVDEDIIKQLADTFVKNRTFLAGNWAMQRAHHGEQADWTLMVLSAFIGQIGLPGGGFGFSMHYAGGGQAFSGVMLPVGLPQGKNKVDVNIPASRISEALLNPGKKINFKGGKLTYPNIKVMYAVGSSVLGHHPNANELIKAIRTLDTVVVHEPWWTPMAKMADIVLPSTTPLERDDMSYGGSYSQDYVYAMKKVIEPLWESRNDYDVFEEMAKRVGEREHRKFTGNRTKMERIKGFYERSDCPNYVSFEDFWEKGYVYFEPSEDAYKYVRHAEFRADPEANKLRTESGKFQIFSQKFADLKLKDFKGHPTWFEPAEWLGDEEKTKKYPFHVLSPHPKYRIHSQLDNCFMRKLYKVGNREPVMINSEDAKKYNIKDGDTVEVFNERGKLLAGAVVTDKIMSGVISICEGTWYDPENTTDEKPRCIAGHVNVLTPSIPTSTMAQSTSANTCLASIKKVDEKAYVGIKAPVVKGV